MKHSIFMKKILLTLGVPALLTLHAGAASVLFGGGAAGPT
jgi:hypothetical protein